MIKEDGSKDKRAPILRADVSCFISHTGWVDDHEVKGVVETGTVLSITNSAKAAELALELESWVAKS